MADKLRSVKTHFWKDPWVTELDSTEKLLFLYLITNPMTNMLGVYEINLREIAFDTGIDKDMLIKLFDRFKRDHKVDYYMSHVILINFLKNQSLNSNMKKGAISILEELKEEIKQYLFENYYKSFETLSNPFKAFQTLRKIEIESEIEKEIESESETENSHPQKFSNHLDLSVSADPNFLNDEQKRERMNAIYNELKNSQNWIEDLRRISKMNEGDTWQFVKGFLDSIKAADDFYKPLSEIKRHCVNRLRKFKPEL